jgi:hypothetical protein
VDRFLDSLTVCSYPKVAISRHFIFSQAETLIRAQSGILPLNRHFWVAAVMGWFYIIYK